MWCLCLCSARSLCSSLTNLTRASPFLRPWALRQSAAPPLKDSSQREEELRDWSRWSTTEGERSSWLLTWQCLSLWRTSLCPGQTTAKVVLLLEWQHCHPQAPSCCCRHQKKKQCSSSTQMWQAPACAGQGGSTARASWDPCPKSQQTASSAELPLSQLPTTLAPWALLSLSTFLLHSPLLTHRCFVLPCCVNRVSALQWNTCSYFG